MAIPADLMDPSSTQELVNFPKNRILDEGRAAWALEHIKIINELGLLQGEEPLTANDHLIDDVLSPLEEGGVMNLKPKNSFTPASHHARPRQQQRSIPQAVVEALLDFGERRPAGTGAESVYFSKPTWRKVGSYVGAAIKGLELCRSCYVIKPNDGTIVTAALRY